MERIATTQNAENTLEEDERMARSGLGLLLDWFSASAARQARLGLESSGSEAREKDSRIRASIPHSIWPFFVFFVFFVVQSS